MQTWQYQIQTFNSENTEFQNLLIQKNNAQRALSNHYHTEHRTPDAAEFDFVSQTTFF